MRRVSCHRTLVSVPTHVYSKRKEGNVLFNDTLNTFYLRLCGVIHMVKRAREETPAATTWATFSD